MSLPLQGVSSTFFGLFTHTIGMDSSQNWRAGRSVTEGIAMEVPQQWTL